MASNMTLVKSSRGSSPGTPPRTRDGRRSGLVRREALLLLLLVLRVSLPLLLLWSWLLLLRWLSMPRGRLLKLAVVSSPYQGLRGGLHRRSIQRAVTSEINGHLAFQTSNDLGGGFVDRPTIRFPGKLLRGYGRA